MNRIEKQDRRSSKRYRILEQKYKRKPRSTSEFDTFDEALLHIKAKRGHASWIDLYYNLYDGSTWQGLDGFASYYGTTYEDESKDVTSFLDTIQKVHGARLTLRASGMIYVTYAYIELKLAGQTIFILPVDAYSDSYTGWNEVGISPYLDADDDDTNCVWHPDNNQAYFCGIFDFENVS